MTAQRKRYVRLWLTLLAAAAAAVLYAASVWNTAGPGYLDDEERRSDRWPDH